MSEAVKPVDPGLREIVPDEEGITLEGSEPKGKAGTILLEDGSDLGARTLRRIQEEFDISGISTYRSHCETFVHIHHKNNDA